jgi:hypothetical protein
MLLKNFADLWGIITALDLCLVLGSVYVCFQITAFATDMEVLRIILSASFSFLSARKQDNFM